MIGIETLLPESIAKAYHVKDFAEPLKRQIDNIVESTPLGDIIDWSLVTPEISDDAAKLVGQFGYANSDEYRAMYRAALFARQLLIMMHGERAMLKLPELPTTRLGLVTESDREDASERAMDYTSEHLGLEDLLGAYTLELDTTCFYGHRIEEIGGYVIMCGEASEAAWYLFDGMNDLRPEQIISGSEFDS